MSDLLIKYYGHSCFTVEAEGFRLVFDPFDNTVPGYKPLEIKADEALCSHGHFDHNYTAAVDFTLGNTNPFNVITLHSFHDDAQGRKRGPNDMRIVEYGGLRLCHFGDIGCHPDEEQTALLKNLDVALIPVGGTYTIDAAGAKKLMDELKPRIIIPMHYRLGEFGFDVLDDLSVFTDQYENVNFPGSSEFAVSGDTPAGVYVLKFA